MAIGVAYNIKKLAGKKMAAGGQVCNDGKDGIVHHEAMAEHHSNIAQKIRAKMMNKGGEVEADSDYTTEHNENFLSNDPSEPHDLYETDALLPDLDTQEPLDPESKRKHVLSRIMDKMHKMHYRR